MRQSLAGLRSCLNLPNPGIKVKWLHIWLCCFVFIEMGIQVTGVWPWTAGCKNLLFPSSVLRRNFWSFCLCDSRGGITGMRCHARFWSAGNWTQDCVYSTNWTSCQPQAFLFFVFNAKKWLMWLWNHSVPFKQVLTFLCPAAIMLLVKFIRFWEQVSLYSSNSTDMPTSASQAVWDQRSPVFWNLLFANHSGVFSFWVGESGETVPLCILGQSWTQ